MSKSTFRGLFVLVFLAALVLRVARLDLRPMHHDEANQAVKFGALLEKGEYRYDKTDHHGPSLYYLSLPLARVLDERTLAPLTESTLRLVTACFGLGTLLLLLFLVPAAGREPVLWSALGLALSPAMVYFSRFYIQETLLLFFLVGFLASVWRYVIRPSRSWAVTAGFFAGMMYATKETAVIIYAAVAGALILILILKKIKEKREEGRGKEKEEKKKNSFTIKFVLHGILAGGVALAVALVLFTSFFQNPKGFLDSIVSFKIYFVRAGEGSFHLQPWFYYLKMLVFFKSGSGPVWSEGLILLLAIVAGIAAFRKQKSGLPDRSFLKFILVYTVISTAVYSLIPYKTPWNLLPFYIGFILLAGSGTTVLLRAFPKICWHMPILLLLAFGFVHFGFESMRANFVDYADPKNPYVYAQTSPDFLKLIRRVGDIAFVHPERQEMLIKVVAGPYETWPLPWYLREFSRVGYWPDAETAADVTDAAVIISSAEEAVKLEPLLQDAYQTEYFGLRPGVLVALHVREDLWEKFFKPEPKR